MEHRVLAKRPVTAFNYQKKKKELFAVQESNTAKKVGDRSRKRPEGSLLLSYYTMV